MLFKIYSQKVDLFKTFYLPIKSKSKALWALSLLIDIQITIISYEGLWQRFSLLFTYIPIACIYYK